MGWATCYPGPHAIRLRYIPKRYKSKKIIKVTLSSITRIRLIIYIKDPKKAPSVDYIYIEEDTKVKKITIVDIATTSHFIKSNTISMSRDHPITSYIRYLPHTTIPCRLYCWSCLLVTLRNSNR